MSYTKLREQLKSGDLARAYRFFGEEEYLKRFCLEEIKSAVLGDAIEEFNFAAFEAGGAVGAMDFAEAPPVMSEKKMIVLNETGIFAEKAGGRDAWAKFFKDLPEYVCVVALEEKADKRFAPYKSFARLGAEVEFTYRPRSEIKAWAARHFERAKKEIGQKELDYLLDFCGRGMTQVKAEIEKIIAYVGERERVTLEDIKTVSVKTVITKEYVLTDALIGGRRAAAFEALREIEAERGVPLRVLSAISFGFISVLKAKALLGEGLPPNQVAGQLGAPMAFIARKNVELAQKSTAAYLAGAIERIKNCDYLIKSGAMEGWAAIGSMCAEIVAKKE